jgi:hypothetical protein
MRAALTVSKLIPSPRKRIAPCARVNAGGLAKDSNSRVWPSLENVELQCSTRSGHQTHKMRFHTRNRLSCEGTVPIGCKYARACLVGAVSKEPRVVWSMLVLAQAI